MRNTTIIFSSWLNCVNLSQWSQWFFNSSHGFKLGCLRAYTFKIYEYQFHKNEKYNRGNLGWIIFELIYDRKSEIMLENVNWHATNPSWKMSQNCLCPIFSSRTWTIFRLFWKLIFCISRSNPSLIEKMVLVFFMF